MTVKSFVITISIKKTMKLFYFISPVLSRECWTPGQIYRGSLARTLDWKPCQYWSSQETFQFVQLPLHASIYQLIIVGRQCVLS